MTSESSIRHNAKADEEPSLPLLTSPSERLLSKWLSRIKIGTLIITFPSGSQKVFSGPTYGPEAEIYITDMKLIWRLIFSGDIGFAESFMAGLWDTPDLSALILLCALNEKAFGSAAVPSWLMKLANRTKHILRANSRRGSRRNISEHYDLGNEFYKFWLDESMSYSSAIFNAEKESLETAQKRKYLNIARTLDLQPGDSVLEIGCGWGAFAEIAVTEFKCSVIGLTLSQEQALFAKKRFQDLGISDNVEIRLQDYRDTLGKFDKVVSIEMFEAVGEENWDHYFNVMKRSLKPGGRIGFQSIVISDEFFDHYRRQPDFIQCYIFPGGILPSSNSLRLAVEKAGLTISDSLYFGSSYSETLKQWHQAFQSNWDSIRKLGFDDRFNRMWRYYLSYCEAGFESERIDVGQFLIEHR